MNFSSKILMFLFSMAFANGLLADHISAGFAGYKHINRDSFEIKFTLFRDADSNAPVIDPNINIQIYSYDGTSYTYERTRNIQSNGTNLVDFGRDNELAKQNGIRMEYAEYTLEHELQIPNVEYIFVFQRCCRIENIVNLPPSESPGLTISTTITTAARNLRNSSVYFDIFPSFIALVNKGMSGSNPVKDDNNNSIIYQFSPIYNGGGINQDNPTSCQGISPLGPCPPPYQEIDFLDSSGDFTKPIESWENMDIDFTTGFIDGIPRGVGSYSYGFVIEERAFGNLINSTRFDYIVHVVPLSVQTDEVSVFHDITIAPNPSYGNFVLTNPSQQNIEIEILDLSGQKVDFESVPHGEDIQISINAPAQVYLLKILTQNESKTYKIVSL